MAATVTAAAAAGEEEDEAQQEHKTKINRKKRGRELLTTTPHPKSKNDRSVGNESLLLSSTKKHKRSKSLGSSATKMGEYIADNDACFKQISSIKEVTEQELNQVPKYMRGRLTCAKVNEAVQFFNQALSKKYHLFSLPEENLAQNLIVKLKQLRRECNNCGNCQFLTEGELLTTTKFRLDSSGKLSLQVLRHLKRIKEIRKPIEKEVSFAILN
jgi:hypothetical protein